MRRLCFVCREKPSTIVIKDNKKECDELVEMLIALCTNCYKISDFSKEKDRYKFLKYVSLNSYKKNKD